MDIRKGNDILRELSVPGPGGRGYRRAGTRCFCVQTARQEPRPPVWVRRAYHSIRHSRRTAGFTLIELLVVIAILSILVALLVPAVQKVREAAARAQCQNNLKQIGLALHNFHDAYNGFPAANQTTPTSQSWTAFILPYIEQQPLADRYRYGLDWDDATTNDADPGGVNQTIIPLFLCPAAPTSRLASRHRGVTDYDAINTITRPNPFVVNMPPSDPTNIGVLGKDVHRRLTDVIDGTSNTILIAESAGRNQLWEMGQFINASGTTGAWANPATEIAVSGFNVASMSLLGSCAVNCSNNNEVYGFHPSGAMTVFADGSVHTLPSGLDVNVLIALMTRAVGEINSPDAYE